MYKPQRLKINAYCTWQNPQTELEIAIGTKDKLIPGPLTSYSLKEQYVLPSEAVWDTKALFATTHDFSFGPTHGSSCN